MSKESRKVIWAGILGNSLELYDYCLYGYFAAVIAKLFFPSDNPVNSLMATYGVFASAFIMRPLSALLFGVMGDTKGRKRALEWSIILMAIPTLFIGLLPTYAQIGILAPIFLTVLRLCQALSVGGEYVGSFSFLVEHAPLHRRCFFGSWCIIGGFIGKIWATLIAAFITLNISEQNLLNWGWRIPFLFGIVFAVSGLLVRRNISETPVFEEMKKSKQLNNSPLKNALRKGTGGILGSVGCGVVGTAGLYLIYVYMPTYFILERGMSYSSAMLTTSLTIAVTIIVLPLSGLIADRWGRKPVLIFGPLALGAATLPLFELIAFGSYPTLLAAHVTFGVIYGLINAPMATLFVEVFDPKIRYTASAIAYNTCVCIFGGITPLVATWLLKTLNTPIAPGYWLVACAVISTFTAFFVPETHPLLIREKNGRVPV